MSVCICLLPTLCVSLSPCVCSCASSLELKNAPNANLRRNGANRNKNANIFNHHYSSSLYFSLPSMNDFNPVSSVLLESWQERGMRGKERKGHAVRRRQPEKEGCWRCSIKLPFFSGTRWFVNLVEINIIQH